MSAVKATSATQSDREEVCLGRRSHGRRRRSALGGWRRSALGGCVLALMGGCIPELDLRDSNVDRTRVLAVVAEPAEARPGATVRYRALVAGPGGTLSSPLRWSYCTTPRTLGASLSVAPECLDEGGVPLTPLGDGEALGTLPLDACARFGPDPPENGARPSDADSTGGYYQPLRIDGLGARWIYSQRVSCNPRNAPADVARELLAAYSPNQNPTIRSFDAWQDGTLVTFPVEAGSVLELRVRFAEGVQEEYVWLSPATSALEHRREGLRVSWFTNRGALELDATGASEDERLEDSSNVWRTPETAGLVTLWAVARDTRGGSATAELLVELE